MPFNEARRAAGSIDKRDRILAGKATIEEVYNEAKNELYQWKRVGDIIMMIIDPPVTPFSPPAQIEAWFERLKTYPQDAPEVQRAIVDAKKYLETARSIEARLNQEPDRLAA